MNSMKVHKIAQKKIGFECGVKRILNRNRENVALRK